jgi:hypothetical protein
MKENRDIRPKYGKKLALAFVLGTAIFLLTFLLGYLVSSYNLQKILQAQEDLRYELLGFQVQQELLEDNCTSFDAGRFSAEMRRLGGALDILEKRLGTDDPAVLEQKKTYSLLEVRHYLYVKEHNDQCANNQIPTILFFYSNSPEYKDEGQKLGYMLTYLWKDDPNILVYSFDYNLDSDIIQILKEKYGVSRPNILVIDEKAVLNVFEDSDQIKALL